MRVGPESAGAMPGPVAYDAGGAQTTFTDAALVLGYINADYLVGGGLKLNAEKARAALSEAGGRAVWARTRWTPRTASFRSLAARWCAP